MSSISVITIFLIRTMSCLADVARIETGTGEEGFVMCVSLVDQRKEHHQERIA